MRKDKRLDKQDPVYIEFDPIEKRVTFQSKAFHFRSDHLELKENE